MSHQHNVGRTESEDTWKEYQQISTACIISIKYVTFDECYRQFCPESFAFLFAVKKPITLVCCKRLWNVVSRIMHEKKAEGFRGQSAEEGTRTNRKKQESDKITY